LGELIRLDAYREPWITKRRLAEELGVTTRYLEYRMSEGMPSRMLAGRRQYRRSVVESWLRDNGHLREG
jgi:hypothetical protein